MVMNSIVKHSPISFYSPKRNSGKYFSKIRNYTFLLIITLVYNVNYIGAQYCNTATTNVAITPTGSSQNTSTYSSGYRAFNFSATSGYTYVFSTCGNSSADTYLRLYDSGTGGNLVTSNDDYCTSQSQISWTCSSSGTYSVLLTSYSCATLSSSTYVSYYYSSSCGAPTSLTTSSVAQTTCTASWTAPGSAPANGYQWEVRTSGAGGSGATGLAASGTTGAGVVSASVTGLSANTTYTLYVRSDCGSSSYSSWASSSTFKTVPSSVTGFTCSTVSATSISCSWTAVTGAYGYYVLIDQSSTYNGDFSGSSIVYDPSVTKTFTGLNPNTTYYVHVTAFNTGWAWSGATNTSGCTTPVDQETWSGGTSTNWNTASNWSGNYVPLSTTNVTIPSGTTFSPSIGSTITAVCKNLTINASATLTIGNTGAGGGSFSIYGDVTNNGNIYHTSDLNTNLYGTSNTFGGTGNFAYNNEFVSFAIQSSANYTLSSNVTMLNQIRISSGGTFNLSSYTISIYTFSFDAGTINLNTGTMEIGNAINYTSGTLNVNTGTIYYNSGATVWTNYGYTAGSQTINSFTYYNLIVRTNNGYTATLGDASTVIVNNDFTILNPSTAGGTASTSYDVTVANNLIVGNTGNALTLNLANRLYRASGTGTITMGNVSGHAINVTYADASNYAISGFGTPTFYGTFTYNSGSAQKVIPATYNNFVSTGSGTKTLYGTVDINGNATLSGGKLAQSTFDITVAGNWTSSGDYFTEGTGTVTFDGSGNSSVSATTAMIGGASGVTIFSEDFESTWTTCSYPNSWSSDRTCGGTEDAGYSAAWHRNDNTGNNWNYSSSGSYSPTFQSGAYSARFHTYGVSSSVSAYIESPTINLSTYTNCSLTFYYKNSGGTDQLEVLFYNGSTWVSQGTYTTSSWGLQTISVSAGYQISGFKVRFKATSDFGLSDIGIDNISLTGDSGTTYSGEIFNKFEVNKTGGGYVTLASNMSAQTSLTLTSGLIKTASYTLTLGTSSANATVTGGSSSSYIVAYDNSGTIGYVKHYVNSNAAYSLPIGDASYYVPMTFTLTSATLSSAYITSYTKAVKVPGLSTSVTNYVNRYWEVSPSGITSPTYTIAYTYDNSDIVGSETNFKPVKKSSGTWYKPTGCTFLTGTAQGTGSLNAATNTLTWSTLTSFSSFGGAGDQAVALPIELLSFDAKRYQGNVKVNWKTASEINNDFFTIERSIDGENFDRISEVDGAGNSTHIISYFMIDTDYKNGINYYRLKQTDYNGSETLSEIVAVDMTKMQGEKIMTVNATGQEVNESYSGLVFDIYSDGTSVKRIQ